LAQRVALSLESGADPALEDVADFSHGRRQVVGLLQQAGEQGAQVFVVNCDGQHGWFEL